MAQLQVGDKLYKTSHYKTIETVIVIDRVTSTQAFVDTRYKFKRDLTEQNTATVIGGNGWNFYYWKLEDSELIEMLFKQKAVKLLNEQTYQEIPIEKIKQALDILGLTVI